MSSDAPPHTEAHPPWEDEEARAAGPLADAPPDVPERDPDTDDMFGAEPAQEQAETPARTDAPAEADGAAYTVLARKYRPRTFEDLIGQDAMVRTLTNAFATGRIAHAFMLTGVRGVGKTTTARLLARALNFEAEEGAGGPSMDLAREGRHCASIMAGQHMDVLEMDAASHTGVGDIRDILDSVRYAPVEARYKVYVLDEVHMLSNQAFNALLKTLEEPPPHAKFIFATTEIRKVPVTILSRCQRFDLRRVEPEVLSGHLARVAEREGARLEQDALALIARAAEGSVRDGLSLLDQALVQGGRGEIVRAEVVRDMLGLADRTQTIALFEAILSGETPRALDLYRTLYGFGADPVQVVSDLLEHAHASALAKTLGPEATRLPADQASRLAALGAAASAGTLSRLWQMLLKAHEEVRRAPVPSDALEMAIIRLAYAADLPGPEEALKLLGAGGSPDAHGSGPRGGGGGAGGGARAALSPAVQVSSLADPQSFEQALRLIGEKRDIRLQLDVERYVRPISFRPGAMTFEPAEGAPADLSRRLASRLKEWTGRTWLIVTESGGGGETRHESERRRKGEVRQSALSEPAIRALLDSFPGAEVIEVRTPAPSPVLPEIIETDAIDDDDAS